MEFKNSCIILSLGCLPLSVFTSSAAKLGSSEALTSSQPVTILPPALLLAKSYTLDTNLSLFYVSEKMDGVRAFWNGRRLISRGGHVIHAPAWFTNNFPKTPLDGELWIGRNHFESISGIARKQIPLDADWKRVSYVVFDLPADPATFSIRYKKLQLMVESTPSYYLSLAKQKQLSTIKELNSMLVTVVAKGGEGLMLHRKESLYRAGRSSDLQKLKPFEDDEAIVVGHIMGKGKYKNMLGSIIVVNKEGVRFRIGSGFSRQERISPPPINSEITYRFRGKTSSNTPRFATFLRMKDTE
jgi:DNA ligase